MRSAIVANWTVIALFAFLAVRPAHAACTCPDRTPDLLLPRDGASGVPRNTRVLVSAARVGAAKWAAADASAALPALKLVTMKGELPKPGAAVKASVSSMLSEAWGTVYVVRPAKPLAAATSYGLLLDEKGDERRLIGTFTTGKASDVTPPQFSGIDKLTAVVSFRPAMNACDGETPFEELTWRYGSATDDLGAPGDLVRFLYVQKKGEPRVLKLVEPVDAKPPVNAVNGSQCDPFRPRMRVGDEICAIVEVLDLAGNVAGSAAEKCMLAKKM